MKLFTIRLPSTKKRHLMFCGRTLRLAVLEAGVKEHKLLALVTIVKPG